MAELIDKKTLIDKFEEVKWKCDKLSDVAQIVGVQAVIDAMPTTTEADIRELVLNEVMAKAREIQEEQIKGLEHSSMRGGKQWAVYMNTHLGHIQTACRRLLAEQLKEG